MHPYAKPPTEASLRRLVGGYLELIFQERCVMDLLVGHAEHLEPVHQAKLRSRKRLFADFLRDVFAARFAERGRQEDAVEAAACALELIHSVHHWSPALGADPGHLIDHLTDPIIDRAQGAVSPLDAAALAS